MNWKSFFVFSSERLEIQLITCKMYETPPHKTVPFSNKTLTVCPLLNEAQFTGSPVSGKTDDIKVLSSCKHIRKY